MFAKYTKDNGLLFKHALGLRDVYGREFHSFHEIFMLIGGQARFTSDEYCELISAGACVLIPSESYHRFDPTCPECEYHRYVLQFDGISDTLRGEVMQHVSVIHTPTPRLVSLFGELCEAQNSDMTDSDRLILLRSVFNRILLELKYGNANNPEAQTAHSRAVAEIIEYIDAHFLENLSVDGIAKELHFSPSYISHKFKAEMGISIYQYLLKKKLIHAYNLIKIATPAAEAAQICGFCDYSTFYKRYKAHFGVSPSNSARSIY